MVFNYMYKHSVQVQRRSVSDAFIQTKNKTKHTDFFNQITVGIENMFKNVIGLCQHHT